MSRDLNPEEELAVKMAASLTERRQAVGPNIVTVLLHTIARLRDAQ
jgi:hypothetical protein